MIKLYNTLTKEKEEFHPLEDKRVRMYTCGPTVYNFIHVGNARMAVFFDAVRRYLEYKGYEVTFVQNITDIDDRIINTSKELGVPEIEISTRYTNEYNQDLKSLNVKEPTVQPKVTEHIPQIILFIERLIDKGYAYSVNGDVYFRVEKFDDYGKLSNQTLENLQHTEREVVEIIDYKENEFDFALWKAQKGSEVTWDSPWGKGRPGWHIECSVMSMQYLGDTFDIHGGGLDLCFPHHENEIAQSEALSDKPLANYWMHNNYVTVEGQKMSKSLGNFTTVRDALKEYDAETIRYFFLSVNYRNPIDYSKAALEQATTELGKIKTTIQNLHFLKDKHEDVGNSDFVAINNAWVKVEFEKAMDNDFDTANAVTALLEYAKKINILMDQVKLNNTEINNVLDTFKTLGDVLGFNLQPIVRLLGAEIEALVQKREELKKVAKASTDKAEKRKLFEEADAIRSSLKEKGIALEDTSNGVRWIKE